MSSLRVITRVPDAERMSDKNFIKHLEKRHAKDTKVEQFIKRHNIGVWMPLYRAFHERCHRIAYPGQYDHEHLDGEA